MLNQARFRRHSRGGVVFGGAAVCTRHCSSVVEESYLRKTIIIVDRNHIINMANTVSQYILAVSAN